MIHPASRFLDFHFYSTLTTHFQGYTKFSHHWDCSTVETLNPNMPFLDYLYSLMSLHPPCSPFHWTPHFCSFHAQYSMVYHLKQHLPLESLLSNLTQNQGYKFTFFIPTPRWLNTKKNHEWSIIDIHVFGKIDLGQFFPFLGKMNQAEPIRLFLPSDKSDRFKAKHLIWRDLIRVSISKLLLLMLGKRFSNLTRKHLPGPSRGINLKVKLTSTKHTKTRKKSYLDVSLNHQFQTKVYPT